VRVLVVEDDPKLSELLSRSLREQAYAVDAVGDGDAALYQVAVNEYDLVLLDVLLPKKDGFTVCRELRKRGSKVPVLMLTARDTVGDRVKGLDTGADDYLTKPFELEELFARMRALLRRQPEMLSATLTVDDLTIDTRTRTAARGGREIPLTTKEYTMLEYLARNAGRVVPRRELSEHVWDENHDPFSNVIEVYINRLRRKVDQEPESPLIHTKRGVGYLLGRETTATGKRAPT
jgi:two-component system copper resistance phosphate regulon response regulator CusR